MEVIRVVLLLCTIVSSVVSSESGRRLYYEPTSISDNCICYPRNDIYTSVPEIIDPEHDGLERLVIYIFKDVQTNEIQMYTPNSRKQSMIPDLPFEIDDSLTTVNEQWANDILYNNPHIISLGEVHNEVKDNRHSKRLVTNTAHHKNSDFQNPTKTAHKVLGDKHSHGIGHGEEDQHIWGVENPNGIVFNEDHHTVWDVDNSNKLEHHKNKAQKHSNGIVLNSVSGNIWDDQNANIFENNKMKDNTIVTPIGLNVGNVEEMNHDSIAIIPLSSDEEESLPSVKAVEDVSGVWPGINAADMQYKLRSKATRLPVHSEMNSGMNYHKGFLYRPGMHSDTNLKAPRDFRKNIDMKPNDAVDADVFTLNTENDVPLSGNQKYLTFDTWFIRQMKSFHIVNQPNDIDSINTMAFRTLIQKSLKENNMFVSEHGVLTDSNGNALDAANLELRPVLLGNPVEYKKVLDGGSSDLKLPKDLPFLEGILITLVYPPKVLGIIPLGKTSLSQVFTPKITKQASAQISAIPIAVSNVALTQRRIANSPQNMRTDAIVVPERPVIKHEVITGNKQMKNEKHEAKKTRAKLKEVTNDLKPADIKPATVNNSRRLITDNILKKLYVMLSESGQGHNGNYDSDDEERPYNKDLPDFRIIGGNAATSSGAPVSNRGRSGINF